MRITVDIDEKTLADLSAITGESKKSPAIAKAVTEFVRRTKAKAFGRRLFEGEFADAFDDNFDPKKLDR